MGTTVRSVGTQRRLNLFRGLQVPPVPCTRFENLRKILSSISKQLLLWYGPAVMIYRGGRDKSNHPGLRLYYWLTVVNVSKRAETLWKCSSDLKEHFHKVSSHLVSSRGVIGTAHPMEVNLITKNDKKNLQKYWSNFGIFDNLEIL